MRNISRGVPLGGERGDCVGIQLPPDSLLELRERGLHLQLLAVRGSRFVAAEPESLTALPHSRCDLRPNPVAGRMYTSLTCLKSSRATRHRLRNVSPLSRSPGVAHLPPSRREPSSRRRRRKAGRRRRI